MSMTTELAQRMKAAALKAKQANDLYLEGKITLSECVVETKDHLDYSDNPNNTLALVEALEASQSENERMYKTLSERNGEPIEGLVQRIAELEARTVKLPATKFCPAEYAGSQLWEEVEIWNKAIEACDAAIRAAGVAVEGVNNE